MTRAEEDQSEIDFLHGKVAALHGDVELLHGKADAIISETRGTRLRFERIEKNLNILVEGQERVETTVLEILAIAKIARDTAVGAQHDAVGARQVAASAQREAEGARNLARSANEQSMRASWTDEIAHEAARAGVEVAKKKELAGVEVAKVTGLEEVEEKRRRRSLRNKIILGGAAAIYGVVMPIVVTLLHGCNR